MSATEWTHEERRNPGQLGLSAAFVKIVSAPVPAGVFSQMHPPLIPVPALITRLLCKRESAHAHQLRPVSKDLQKESKGHLN